MVLGLAAVADDEREDAPLGGQLKRLEVRLRLEQVLAPAGPAAAAVPEGRGGGGGRPVFHDLRHGLARPRAAAALPAAAAAAPARTGRVRVH